MSKRWPRVGPAPPATPRGYASNATTPRRRSAGLPAPGPVPGTPSRRPHRPDTATDRQRHRTAAALGCGWRPIRCTSGSPERATTWTFLTHSPRIIRATPTADGGYGYLDVERPACRPPPDRRTDAADPQALHPVGAVGVRRRGLPHRQRGLLHPDRRTLRLAGRPGPDHPRRSDVRPGRTPWQAQRPAG